MTAAASSRLQGRSSTLLPAVTVGWGRAAREPTGMVEVTRAGMARIIHSGLEWGSAGLEASDHFGGGPGIGVPHRLGRHDRGR